MNIDQAGLTDGSAGTTDDRRPLYRVLATSEVFEPGFRGGGPVRSLAHIIDTLPSDIDLALVTRDRDLGSSIPYPGLSGRWVRRTRSRVHYLNTRSPSGWFRLTREVRAQEADLLYVNSLWSLFSLVPIVGVATRMLPVRTILVAPRGELSPGALKLKARKKRLFLRAWTPLLRRLGVRWQACSELEAEHIRAAFPWAQVMVNGHELALPLEPVPSRARPSGPLRLVFISRISPIKNLELALQALQRVSEPVSFDIFGPLEDTRYWSRCRHLIERMPANVRVSYRGELAPDQVIPTFGGYDRFLFPTSGENFGHVIIESLAASCPVICSAATPWSDLIEQGGGAVVRPLTAARLAEHLNCLARSTREERRRAHNLAGATYRSWRQRNQGNNVLDDARHFC